MKIIGYSEIDKKNYNVNDVESGDFICPFYLKALNRKVKLFKVVRDGLSFFRYEKNFNQDPLINEEIKTKTKTGGESLLHFNTKVKLSKLISLNKQNVQLEKVFKTESLFRIADIYCEHRGKKQVYEIQISNITLDNLIKRTSDYTLLGISNVIWVLNEGMTNLDYISEYLLNNGYKYGVLHQTKEKKLIANIILD